VEVEWWRRRRSLLRIVHARGSIPDEVGPTRCRATPAVALSADETLIWNIEVISCERRRRRDI
jgi:hypothetical protein